MSALALDIGTYTIKAISGKPGKKVDVVRVAEIFNTTNFSIPTDDTQVEQLTQLLDTFIKDHKLPVTDVRLSLPESIISTKVIDIPRLSDAELASAIGWQAEQYIPIPPEELSLEYKVLFRPKKSDRETPMRVLLIGARKPVIERYISMFTLLGIEPTLLETHILSVIRAMGFEANDATTLVVHIGASTMNMAMVHQGELLFVFNHMSGGQMLTRSLEQDVGLDSVQAEQYKRAYGLDKTQFQGKVAAALQTPVKVMTDEMHKAIRFFINKHHQETVQRVLISGGVAQLPGLVQQITETLGLEVLVAAPFAAASGAIPETNHPALSVCMGLLMRDQ